MPSKPRLKKGHKDARDTLIRLIRSTVARYVMDIYDEDPETIVLVTEDGLMLRVNVTVVGE